MEFRNVSQDVVSIFTICYAVSSSVQAMFEFFFRPKCSSVEDAQVPFGIGLLCIIAGIAGLIHNYEMKSQQANSTGNGPHKESFGPSPLMIHESSSVKLFFPPAEIPELNNENDNLEEIIDAELNYDQSSPDGTAEETPESNDNLEDTTDSNNQEIKSSLDQQKEVGLNSAIFKPVTS
jgi:hypothetical protein